MSTAHILKTNVDSSNIDAYAYDPHTKILSIEFKSGRTYNYSGVDHTTADAFDTAESKGRFHATEIRGEFDFERLEDA